QARDGREAGALRVRLRAHRIAARALQREVLSGRDPLPRVRHRVRFLVPVGGLISKTVLRRRHVRERLLGGRDLLLTGRDGRLPRRRHRGAGVRLEKKGNRMGLEFYPTRLADAVNWARKYSLFQYPFVTACCGMEFMAVWAPKYDIARFGAEFPRFS